MGDGIVLKRSKKTGIVIMVIIILITISMVASISNFNTPNFVMSGVGLVRVVFTEAEVVQIQSYPQIYLAKPDKAQQKLIDFMMQNGYQYLEDERMASTLAFGNEASKQYVDLTINKYFSKWAFNE
jgi:hypothetical protein